MNYNTFRFDVAGLPRSSRKKLAWTGQDQRLRKALGANALAQMRHRRRIAKKIPKAHGLSLMHWLLGGGWERSNRIRRGHDRDKFCRQVAAFDCIPSELPPEYRQLVIHQITLSLFKNACMGLAHRKDNERASLKFIDINAI